MKDTLSIFNNPFFST